jgi:hypothetical protein
MTSMFYDYEYRDTSQLWIAIIIPTNIDNVTTLAIKTGVLTSRKSDEISLATPFVNSL